MAESGLGGRTEEGYLAVPEGSHGPGVLVLHAWWGLTPFFEDVCDRLGATGFVALAPDRYGGPTAATIEEAETLQRAREDTAATEVLLTASAEFLRAHEAVAGEGLGVLGFSAGASWALVLSTREPELVRAVVAFYGTAQADYSLARGLPWPLRPRRRVGTNRTGASYGGRPTRRRARGHVLHLPRGGALVLRGGPSAPLRRAGRSPRLGTHR
jgi:dienelactone hydrolase